MNMHGLRFGATAIVSVLWGCTQLDVSVHVLDHERIPLEKRVESIVWLEAQRYSREIESGFYLRLESTLIGELDAVLDVISPVIPAGVNRAGFSANSRRFARDSISKARKASEKGISLYESVRYPGAPDRGQVLEQALFHLQEGRARVRTIAATVEDEVTNLEGIDGVDRDALDDARAKMARAFEETSALAQSRHPLFGGATLFHDPLASWVVSADKDAWQGTFNRSYGSGYFGNVDVAVKMEADGVFTLKGVRLDASKTTEATFAVIRQTLNIAAAGIGPVEARTSAPQSPTAPLGAGAAPPDVSSVPVAEAKEAMARERLQREQAQYALSAIFDVVVRNAAQISAGDAQRKQAIEQIKIVYQAYRPLISAAQQD